MSEVDFRVYISNTIIPFNVSLPCHLPEEEDDISFLWNATAFFQFLTSYYLYSKYTSSSCSLQGLMGMPMLNLKRFQKKNGENSGWIRFLIMLKSNLEVQIKVSGMIIISLTGKRNTCRI